MNPLIKRKSIIVILFILLSMSLATVQAQPLTPKINEFVFNHVGADSNAFIEIFGSPDTDYSSYTVLEIEGESTSIGVIDAVLSVGTTSSDGYWVDDEDVENGTVTLLLVQGFTDIQGTDLDTNDMVFWIVHRGRFLWTRLRFLMEPQEIKPMPMLY